MAVLLSYYTQYLSKNCLLDIMFSLLYSLAMTEFRKPDCQTECPIYEQRKDLSSDSLTALTRYCLGTTKLGFEDEFTALTVTICDSPELLDNGDKKIESVYVERHEIEQHNYTT